jgi:hypothetical protein
MTRASLGYGDHRLPTTFCPLRTLSLLPASQEIQPTADCLLPTAYCVKET